MELTGGVRWITVDDGLVIFAPSSPAFVDLDRSGRELFELMHDAAWDVDEATRRLEALHDLAPGEAREAVADFTASLQHYGVLSSGR